MASSGNFCVFTADLRYESPYSASDQHSGGGLSVKGPSTGSFEPNQATFTPISGKWYWEYRAGQGGGSSYGRPAIAVSNQAHTKNEDYYGGSSGITGVLFQSNDGNKRINGSTTSYGTAVSQNDIVQMALDCDNGAMYFGINNTWQNSGDPTSGTNKTGAALSTGIQNVPINIQHTRYAGGGIDRYNFGQDSTFDGAVTASTNADGNGHGTFAYSPPSGYLALCSANLPLAEAVDSAQDNPPSNYTDVLTYTGTGSTQSITGLNFQPDWVLIKNRDVADSWLNMNSVTGLGKTHAWDAASPYQDETDCVTAFNSNGFTVSTNHRVNASTEKYVAYCWKKSADAGFDIVEYSGTSGTQAVSHNLGAEPEMIMMHLKSGTNVDGTMFMNSSVAESMGSTEGVFMSLSNAKQTTSYMSSVSSTNFTMPSTSMNQTGRTYVAYVFRGIQGFSKFGQYEGNGDADGPFIFLGFRPRHFFIKKIDGTGNWEVRDTARDINNPLDTTILWDSNTLEASSAASTAYPVDVFSNGFKIRTTSGNYNTANNGYIYGAWADVPFKYNNAF